MTTADLSLSGLDLPKPCPNGESFPGLQRFSTRGLQGTTRVELWEEHNARALVGLECRTINATALDATEINLQLGSLQLAHVSANPHIVERSTKQIELTPTDGVALYFTLYGESFFYHQNGVHLQQPGGLLVCDVNRPFMRGFAHGLQEFALRVPLAVFQSLTEASTPSNPVTMSFTNSPESNAHATALARLLRSTMTSLDAGQLLETEQMALGYLRGIFSADVANASAAHRLAAENFIESQLRNQALGAGQIARAIGISERHLSRVFAETGTGVARVILEKRLDLAHRILTSKSLPIPTIGQIAASCGFSASAHFSRAFRERFEQTPGDVRASRR